MVYHMLVVNDSDKKYFSPTKTIFKMVALMFFTGLLTMVAIIDAPVNFEKECVTYTEIDEEKGVVITLPDGSYEVIQVNANSCKQPVQDGVFNNVLHHTPFDFWINIVFIAVLSVLFILYAHDLLKYYVNKN